MDATILQRLHNWFASDIGEAYGISQLRTAAGTASFVGQPPAMHFNPHGGVQGGYIASLFDAALGFAVYSSAMADAVYVTASLHVHYLRPLLADALPLRTEARVLQRDGREVTAEATLHDARGQLCSTAHAIFKSPRGTASGALAE
nr:PaaI family thioesterase [uncultured Pseudomonas sp.]